MPVSIHHVSECEVDMGEGRGEGRGQPQNNALDHSFKALPRSSGLQVLVWLKLLLSTGKKLAFQLSVYIF